MCRVTTHLEKSGNSKVVKEKSGKMEKVGKWNQVRFFKLLNTPKPIFRPDPTGGAYDAPEDLLVGWGGGHPIPFPQLLQPQQLNNWLSGLTLFFINMK